MVNFWPALSLSCRLNAWRRYRGGPSDSGTGTQGCWLVLPNITAISIIWAIERDKEGKRTKEIEKLKEQESEKTKKRGGLGAGIGRKRNRIKQRGEQVPEGRERKILTHWVHWLISLRSISICWPWVLRNLAVWNE